MTTGPAIFIVDDDMDDCDLLTEFLKRANPGYTYTSFNSGNSVMQHLLQSLPAKHNLPQLIVLDVNMPQMDGREVVKAIRQHAELNNISLVILSTSSNKADREYFADYGIDFFTKPTNMSGYRQIAQKLMSYLPSEVRNSSIK
jgi:CheY-like chemotaxis protein